MQDRKLFRFGWAVAVILTMYTHPYGVFVIAASGIVFLIYRRPTDPTRIVFGVKQLLITTALASLFMIPQLWSVVQHFISSAEAGETKAWLQRPDLDVLVHSFANFMMTTGKLIAGFCIVGFIALILTYRAERTSAQARIAIWIFMLWIGIVMLLPMLLSATVVPFYTTRYATPALIGLILLIAVVLSEWKPPLRTVGVVAVIAFSVYPLYSYYTLGDKDPWREAAEILESRVKPDESMIVFPEFQRLVLDYYFDGSDIDITYIYPDSTYGNFPPKHDIVWWVQGYDWYATDTLSQMRDLKQARFAKESEICIMDSVKRNPRAFYMADIRLIRYARGNEK